ncbi:MAG: tyrosine-type recombinase/integrase [Pseudomonadales bacterium]
MTFLRVAEEFIDNDAAGWTNRKHGQQWRNTLKTYAFPVLGGVAVRDVTTDQVLQVLTLIWTEKTETAKRLQGRIERVLDYATTKGHREGDNPARWRGHLDMLPRPGKAHGVEHQRALPYLEAPALAAKLVDVDTAARRALLLTLLCATRTSETLEASWSEIDLDCKEWRIPAVRMKAGKEHRIPLCDAAVAVQKAQAVHQGERGDPDLPRTKARKMPEQYGHDECPEAHGLAGTNQRSRPSQHFPSPCRCACRPGNGWRLNH